ncbi:MAG: hypothetical protein KatS3mg090_0087 [Patescibacteria group bacterium]|nr:MAG: hypothetical protein KatS3mg090_0087 [Patescibacteria group bacterium]
MKAVVSPVKIWRRQSKISSLLGKTGRVITYTVIRSAPAGYAKFSPYTIVLVEFDDNSKAIGQYRGSTPVFVGMNVKAVLRLALEESGDEPLVYTVKFVEVI